MLTLVQKGLCFDEGGANIEKPVEWRIHWQIQYHPRANVKQWLEHDRYIFSTNQDTRSMAGEDTDAKQTEYRICVRKPVVEYTSWRRKEIWVQL